jgi:glycosyltransferase involved in cell wall biosynthesis
VISSVAEYDGPETFSRVIIEAWQNARPVVSFAVGGPKYLIDDEADGLLVPEKDVSAMAKALIRVWKDESLRVRLGQAGRRKVEEKFVAGKVAEAVVEAIVNAPSDREGSRLAPSTVLERRVG